MAREVSDAFKEAFWGQETDRVATVLLEIDHEDLGSTPLRFALNTEIVVSSGIEYLPFPFEVEMPADVPGKPIQAVLRIDNIDRSIAQTLRDLATAPTAQFSIVLSDNPKSKTFGFAAALATELPLDIVSGAGSNFPAESAFYIAMSDGTTFETTVDSVSPASASVDIIVIDDQLPLDVPGGTHVWGPNPIEFQTPALTWDTTSIDGHTIEGVLSGPQILNRSYPMDDFTPSTFPALFFQ